MERIFERQSRSQERKRMLKVDFFRLFTTPLLYIMAGISLVMPVLILVMTTMAGTDETAGFTNVWQSVSSLSGSASSMDLVSMCNINLIYFLACALVCTFVADDFRSGYAKNLFAVRPRKGSYVFSKTVVSFAGGAILLLCYLAGAMVGGAVAGLSFDAGEAGAGGIALCMLAKIGLMSVFASLFLVMSVIAKNKLWLSVLLSLGAGMLLFTMIPMMTPLDSSFVNVLACFAGGALFAVGLGAASSLILNKTSLV